ncbi:hypothetical protein FQN52_009600 [Onygenales sp. PD_12]|nr:hypothetical protein FQN52_009600 [Onygenales sp. PD_12]
MSQCRHRLYQALQQHGTARTDYVWISDDTLSDTFFRFAKHHRRHGSSVPGPLEAQKRAARRRHVDLARMGCPAPPVDVGVLFGKPGQNTQWQPIGPQPWPAMPQGMAELPERAGQMCEILMCGVEPFPPYDLAQTPPPPPPPPPLNAAYPPETPEPRITRDPTTPAINYTSTKVVLEKSTWQCASLDEFRTLIPNFDPTIRDPSLVSRAIFSYILEKWFRRGQRRCNVVDLHAFLDNPSLNIPGSENYLLLINHLVRRYGGEGLISAHFRFLRQAISLGLVPADEIAKILKIMPSIKTETGTLKSSNPEKLVALYRQIWHGLQSSSVMGPQDLDRDILTSWAKDHLKLAGQLNLDQAADVILCHLVLTTVPDPASGNPGVADEDRRETLLTWIQSHIEMSHPDIALKYIMDVTTALIFSPHYNQRGSELLTTWCWVLRRLESESLLRSTYSLFNFEADSTSIASRMNNDEFHGYQRYIRVLQLWVVAVLGSRRSAYKLRAYRRKRVFNSLLVRLDKEPGRARGTDILTHLHLLLQDLVVRGLPAADFVLRTAASVEFYKGQRKFQVKNNVDNYLDPELKQMFRNPTRTPLTLDDVLANYFMYTRRRSSTFSVFETLARKTDIASPRFLEQIISYTDSGTVPRSAIIHLLRHHTPLKIALSHSWRQQSPPTPRPPGLDPCIFPDPFASLRMLHTLALVFACSPKLSPMNSWRLTRWVYRYIVHHSGPVEPVLARALYQAGVVRFREAKMPVPVDRFRFIMDMIRNSEGGEVADGVMYAERI